MEIDRAVIEVNGGCNFTCKMCPQTLPGRPKDFLKKMSLEQFEDMVIQTKPNVVNLDGSGEATLNTNLPKYIEIVKKHGAKAFIFSNGYNMRGKYMRDCVDAGLDFYRFSIIGYDEDSYALWMNRTPSDFYHVLENLDNMHFYAHHTKSDIVVATYHLILGDRNINPANRAHQMTEYQKIIWDASVVGEIWAMHNWAGNYENEYKRKGKIKTCGRPFSPDIVIRANGVVHPCCQVLGKGREEDAILGNVNENTVEEIWNGYKYNRLREQHRTGDYPDFCKGCDFLIDDQEVLVWTNHDRDLYKMHGTNFDLNNYRS